MTGLRTVLRVSDSTQSYRKQNNHTMSTARPEEIVLVLPESITLLTKFTMALAGCSVSSSAKTWHWLQALLVGFLATKANSLLERGGTDVLTLHLLSSGSTPQWDIWGVL